MYRLLNWILVDCCLASLILATSSSDSYISLKIGTHVWKSSSFEPGVRKFSFPSISLYSEFECLTLQLFDLQDRCVASDIMEPCSFKKRPPRTHTRLAPEIANDPVQRDMVVASHFVFKFCRDVKMPWHKRRAPELTQMVLQATED